MLSCLVVFWLLKVSCSFRVLVVLLFRLFLSLFLSFSREKRETSISQRQRCWGKMVGEIARLACPPSCPPPLPPLLFSYLLMPTLLNKYCVCRLHVPVCVVPRLFCSVGRAAAGDAFARMDDAVARTEKRERFA